MPPCSVFDDGGTDAAGLRRCRCGALELVGCQVHMPVGTAAAEQTAAAGPASALDASFAATGFDFALLSAPETQAPAAAALRLSASVTPQTSAGEFDHHAAAPVPPPVVSLPPAAAAAPAPFTTQLPPHKPQQQRSAAPAPPGERGRQQPARWRAGCAVPDSGGHRRNVYAASLPSTFTVGDLRRLFAPFGAVVAVRIFNNSAARPGGAVTAGRAGAGGGGGRRGGATTGRAFGFVLFQTEDGATRAINALAGATVDGQRIQVRRAKSEEDPAAAGCRRGGGSRGARRVPERLAAASTAYSQPPVAEAPMAEAPWGLRCGGAGAQPGAEAAPTQALAHGPASSSCSTPETEAAPCATTQSPSPDVAGHVVVPAVRLRPRHGEDRPPAPGPEATPGPEPAPTDPATAAPAVAAHRPVPRIAATPCMPVRVGVPDTALSPAPQPFAAAPPPLAPQLAGPVAGAHAPVRLPLPQRFAAPLTDSEIVCASAASPALVIHPLFVDPVASRPTPAAPLSAPPAAGRPAPGWAVMDPFAHCFGQY